MSSIDMCHSSKPRSTFDFEGLEESLVDNNEDDDDEDFIDPGLNDTGMIADPSGSGIMFDHNLFLIRDALIRDSANRTEEDIEIIVRFLSIINSNHDHMTRKRLAPHFVLAEIEARDTRVLTHGEKLDAYCIVAAGSLRHVLPCDDEILLQETIGSSVDEMDNFMLSSDHNCLPQHLRDPSSHHLHQNVRYLHVGDEFGAHLDDRVVYGEIFTNEDFVWVLCVPHVIFDQICGEKTFKTIRDEVTGNIIEMRANCLLPGPADTNSLGSTNLTASDLSLSQSNDPLSKSLHYSLPEDFPPPTAVVPNANSAPNASALPPKSLPLPSAKQPTVTSSDSNELIRATKDRLYELLLNTEPSETFIEDFLLTFRIWSEKDLQPSKDSMIMTDLMNRICTNIRNSVYVENCVRIVLIWLVNHYQDFHGQNRFLLEQFENVLKENFAHKSQLRLFYMNLSAKSCERRVTVTRSDRNSPLPFSLIGGYECSARLFIGEIVSNQSLPDLRPGDRVISINGDDCHSMKIGDAYTRCRNSTHLSLQVKYDPHLFYALIEGRHETKRQIVETFPLNNRLSSSTSTTNFGSSSTNLNNLSSSASKDVKKEGGMWKQKVRSFVSNTTNQLINSTTNILNNNNTNNSNSSNQQPLNNSLSNSSISSIPTTSSSSGFSSMQSQATHTRILSYEVPEIIKIYLFENNDCRFLPIHSSTTARECIQLAMREFQLTSNYSSLDFALYEYSVIFNNSNSANGAPDENSMASSTVIKRLNDKTSDLVNNLGLNSRLYLKLLTQPKESTSGGNTLSDSDIAKEIIKDSSTNSLLTLNGSAIARELTARDFRLFCKIEAQQFVYDLAFNDPNSSQSNNQSSSILFERTRELQEFERKTNEEMFWTINQVLGEKRSLTKRVKAIKQLIRIATLAMKLNNYNTLFAILSGLMHLSVSRLKSCWDRVPAKHMKQLQKLQQLMDPSRNFYNFRQQLMQILRQDSGASIIIPFFPLVKKDLSFIWLANQTYVNSTEPQTPSSGSETKTPKTEMLVNWEKMRLLAEKIREIQKMANTTSLALAAVNGLSHSAGNNVTSPSLANEPIDPNLLFRIFADTIYAEDPRTFSHKKLWETQRMAKRVQSFLDETFISISSDEHELMSRSYSCELPQTPNSSHATTRSSIASTMSSNSQMSHPSPTPSTASSSSNSLSMHSDGTPGGPVLYRPQRPKFGQTSPKQLRKLLALSDGAVIVPHNNSGSSSSVREHHNSSTGASSSHHYHHHHSHHHHQYSQHNTSTRASNSSLNSNPSSTNSYYNNIYGCHPQYPMHPDRPTSSAYRNGTLAPNNYGPGSGSSHSKMPYSSMIEHHSMGHLGFSTGSNCCSMMPPCCSSAQNSSALFPNQPYCSCCTTGPMMRPSMLVMPQQQSGLMHPGCSCGPSQGSGRRQNSLPPKQSLPVESSSVTSLRRLEQYQQMTRHREIRQQQSQQTQPGSSKHSSSSNSRRPQCPDYDTTMQRICGSNSMSINGMVPKGASSHHRGQNHREDIV